jgi:hypothetical protein
LELFKFALLLEIELVGTEAMRASSRLAWRSIIDRRQKDEVGDDGRKFRGPLSSVKIDQSGVAICGTPFGVVGARRGAAGATEAAAGSALGFTVGAFGTLPDGFAFCIVRFEGRGRGNGGAPRGAGYVPGRIVNGGGGMLKSAFFGLIGEPLMSAGMALAGGASRGGDPDGGPGSGSLGGALEGGGAGGGIMTTTPSGLAATIRLTARIAPLRPSTTTRMRISRESMTRSTYVVPSRCGSPSGEKPASRTILLISKGCTRPGEGAGAAVDIASDVCDWAWRGTAANRRQHRGSAAAPNIPAIADLAPLAKRAAEPLSKRDGLARSARPRTRAEPMASFPKGWLGGFGNDFVMVSQG